MKNNLVVIGNGMVGHHFVIKAIEQGLHLTHEIHVFGEENVPAYDRVQMSSYFETPELERLNLVDLEEYRQAGVHLYLGEAITALDTERKVIASEKRNFHYETLVLATGSYPFVPPVPGHEHENCFVYRTVDDLDAIIAAAKGKKVGTIVGGGLLGLEAAKALVNLGLKSHVVEFAPRLMGVQLDETGSALLNKKILDMDVTTHLSKNTREIVAGEDCDLRMNFTDDTALETDIIVFSAGIRPQDTLAKAAGLEVGARGGIKIDNQCKTSADGVYAIGECALWENRIYGLVAPGYTMASSLAKHLAGDSDASFMGADMSTKLKLMGVEVGSLGDAHAAEPGALTYTYMNPRTEVYKKLVTSSDGKKLLGAILVGDTSDYNNLLQLFLNEIELPDEPESLILPNVSGAPAMGVDMLPASAQICSCYSVSKGDICQAVIEGATDVAAIKKTTCAATGCGGCVALVKDVLNAQLESMGVEVNTDLCEHFGYTRADLYNLVRVGELKTFAELHDKHGRGSAHGCEICKPVATSIFASCWNEFVLKPEHAPLQDTNDYFMGNMQKDGSYSVVPRVAGGEILPDQLIALGEVAKEYGLYSKITGGQRVDLFGARVEQLPGIWQKLIDAGFETGHAYGKSLRTVKSCVGSTWCRYGVDDSVGLAIELENRYKGMRSPHKVKMGVSGCTRECAEAQGKDIGVIAVEGGWSLYVCGNGGMRPRHADLFATGLNSAELISMIDRVLMFYIKTADRLQRMSVWLENLEGGLEYLKKVILEDKLGLGEELEAQMQLLVDNYVCEWKAALDTPETLKRFRHFVNSDQPDSSIEFVDERGQIKPKPKKIELVEA